MAFPAHWRFRPRGCRLLSATLGCQSFGKSGRRSCRERRDSPAPFRLPRLAELSDWELLAPSPSEPALTRLSFSEKKKRSRDVEQVSDDVSRLFLNCLSKQTAGNTFADEAAAQREACLPELQHMSQHGKEERLNRAGVTSGSWRSQALLQSSCGDRSAEWRWPTAGNGRLPALL